MHSQCLFLEKHDFVQFITPLTRDCAGFVTIAKENARDHSMEIINIKIPFGSILLINPGVIHGDSTLKGLYLMGMTGNHHAMNTADTVFLKYGSGLVNTNFIDENIHNSVSTGKNLLLTHSHCNKAKLFNNIKLNIIPQLLKNVFEKHPLKYWLWRPIIANLNFINRSKFTIIYKGFYHYNDLNLYFCTPLTN